MKIYQAIGIYCGQFENAYEDVLGTFLNKENAEKVINEIRNDESHKYYGFYIAEFKVKD